MTMTEDMTLPFDPYEAAAGIPPGTYQFQISKAECKLSKASDTEMVELELAVVNDPDNQGRNIWDRVSASRKAAWKLVEFAKAIGVDARLLLGNILKGDCNDLIGTLVYAEVVTGTDNNGNPRSEIGHYKES